MSPRAKKSIINKANEFPAICKACSNVFMEKFILSNSIGFFSGLITMEVKTIGFEIFLKDK